MNLIRQASRGEHINDFVPVGLLIGKEKSSDDPIVFRSYGKIINEMNEESVYQYKVTI